MKKKISRIMKLITPWPAATFLYQKEPFERNRRSFDRKYHLQFDVIIPVVLLAVNFLVHCFFWGFVLTLIVPRLLVVLGAPFSCIMACRLFPGLLLSSSDPFEIKRNFP